MRGTALVAPKASSFIAQLVLSLARGSSTVASPEEPRESLRAAVQEGLAERGANVSTRSASQSAASLPSSKSRTRTISSVGVKGLVMLAQRTSICRLGA